jgi:hypothetical protein
MNNPKAFPMNWVKQEAPNLNVIFEQQGMTLRDYFAAKAMQGFAAYIGPSMAFESRAKVAYDWADAMLKAREQ